jgi:undecaprenyl diphosphate synthase
MTLPAPALPEHLAIIMDGNGRWAESRGKLRISGHREGAKRVDEIVTEAAELGIKYLTLYTFSTENWNRPESEVSLLMRLLVENLKTMDKKLLKNGISLSAQGTLDRLPEYARKELERVVEITHRPDPKMRLSLALSYGGRQEIVDAVKAIANKVKEGEISPEAISEETIRTHLYHPHFPDPDLMIRTGGESRISNFLLWEVAYTELLVVNEFWPEFNSSSLHSALSSYGQRQRRFGKTSHQILEEQTSAPVNV